MMRYHDDDDAVSVVACSGRLSCGVPKIYESIFRSPFIYITLELESVLHSPGANINASRPDDYCMAGMHGVGCWRG